MLKKQQQQKETTNKKNTKRVNVKRTCRFCMDSENIIDYKRTKMLTHFISERCKIAPRRVTGNCQFHQTRIVEAIKRARHLALLPYTVTHMVRPD